ncbi:hypothetical protein DRQ25_18345 [Candidatus Fermentibacteria bacterium]|nr:MAG: hypothetical protein DRQ25_18345 [Candidatus Fermentibacteria bacterium]
MKKHEERNLMVFTEIEAIIEKLSHGKVDIAFDIHNQRITGINLQGQKRTLYKPNDRTQPFLDIGKRIKDAAKTGQNTDLVFIVGIRKGKIGEVNWHSNLFRDYEALDTK